MSRSSVTVTHAMPEPPPPPPAPKPPRRKPRQEFTPIADSEKE